MAHYMTFTQCNWQSLAQLKLFGNVSMQMFLRVYSVQCFVLSCHNNRSGKKIKDKVTGKNNKHPITCSCLNKSLDERKNCLTTGEKIEFEVIIHILIKMNISCQFKTQYTLKSSL